MPRSSQSMNSTWPRTSVVRHLASLRDLHSWALGVDVPPSREMRSRVVTSPSQGCTIADVAIIQVAAASSPEAVRVGQTRSAAVCALSLASVALVGGAATLTLLGSGSAWWIAAAPAVLVPATAGCLIALYRPANLIGRLLLLEALIVSLAFLAAPYARYGLVTSPGSLPAARWALLWDSVGWPTMFGSVVALVLAFPNGRVAPGMARRVAVTLGASFAVVQVAALFEPQHYAAPYVHVSNPLPSLPAFVQIALTPFWLAAFGGLFAAAWVVRTRFRRATGIERLQFMWLAYGALLIPLALIACLLERAFSGGTTAFTAVALVTALTAVPAAIGVAVLRHRLFAIELVLSRTIVYGSLTGSVVGGYLALVVGLDRLIPAGGVAGVTAAGLVALAFQPLRETIQGRVERLVYGDRSDPYGALTRLGQRLQTAPDPAQVVPTIVDDVKAALRLGYCAVALSRDGVMEVAAARGRSTGQPQVLLRLVYQGDEIGLLIAEPPAGGALSSRDRRLLDDLARQAGAAVHGVRVLADLQRSRERLIAAREEERLRLRRDLHDGLGPTLAALVFKIGMIRDGFHVDERSDRLLEELDAQTRDAIADIRRLVYALRPPALDDLGLAGALREQAALLSQGGHIHISVTCQDLPPLPAAIEVAVYRIATEALTNVVRHAGATHCTVALRLRDVLELEVDDDGIGPMRGDVRMGVGVRSMHERADELGGAFEIGRSCLGGTRVAARFPVAP